LWYSGSILRSGKGSSSRIYLASSPSSHMLHALVLMCVMSFPVPLLRLQISRMPKQNGSRGRTVVITQGSSPTVVAVNGRVTLYPVIALPADKLVDTNGAGVCTHGFASFQEKSVSVGLCTWHSTA
jgi:hypothetical protein